VSVAESVCCSAQNLLLERMWAPWRLLSKWPLSSISFMRRQHTYCLTYSSSQWLASQSSIRSHAKSWCLVLATCTAIGLALAQLCV